MLRFEVWPEPGTSCALGEIKRGPIQTGEYLDPFIQATVAFVRSVANSSQLLLLSAVSQIAKAPLPTLPIVP